MSAARKVTTALQRRIVPELRYSQTTYEDHLREHAAASAAWLELGCGHQLLPAWRGEAERELVARAGYVVGLDYDLASLRKHRSIRNRCRGDVTALPFRDATFDLVTANMVVEHLADPVAQFREVRRVLAPGGTFLFHTPNERSYPTAVARLLPDRVKQVLARALEGRAAEDVFPTHYRANDAEVIRRVATEAGLEVAAIHHVGSVPVFATVPPVAVVELLAIRQLMRRPSLERYRQTLICVLRRPRD